MDITYKPFGEAYLADVLKLQHEWAQEYITFGVGRETAADILGCQNEFIFIALDGGAVTGYITAEIIKENEYNVFPKGASYLRVNNLFVKKEYRSNGIGKSLLLLVEEKAHANGLKHIFIPSAAKDAAAIRNFYERSGYNIWTTMFYKRMGNDVRIYDLNELGCYRFVVIFARYKHKWLYSREKKRTTFETAGGHIELGETPIEAAKRELFEETGALKYEIKPIFDYSVYTPTEFSNGQVFLADIAELGRLPESEMAEVKLFDTVPGEMTYPHILPALFEKVRNSRKHIDIRPINEKIRPKVTEFIIGQWYSTDMLIRGEVIDMTKVDGFAVLDESETEIIGLATYILRNDICEMVSLNSTVSGRGIGTALVDMVLQTAKSAGCKKLQLLTTNDNINAIRFYQKRGFDLIGINYGAIDIERAKKPQIPLIGMNGIPLRHEVEFAMELEPPKDAVK